MNQNPINIFTLTPEERISQYNVDTQDTLAYNIKQNFISNNKKLNNLNSWQLYDKLDLKEDGDQLKTVTGICFTFLILIILGLYSNFL